MINKTLTPVKDCAFVKDFFHNGKICLLRSVLTLEKLYDFPFLYYIEYREIRLEGKLDPRGIVATYFVLSFVELLPLRSNIKRIIMLSSVTS